VADRSTTSSSGIVMRVVAASICASPSDGWVVLAGAYAYKLWKPVNLGFLDFSTLEPRARHCAEEVRLNRRLSPDVYLGVVEVVEREGAGRS
jgi:aminoglycoside phosphotransferase family enzyme